MNKQLSLIDWLKVFMAYCCERSKKSFPQPKSPYWNTLFFSYKKMNPGSSATLDDVRRSLAIMNVKEDVITERAGGRIALKEPTLVLSWLEILKENPSIEPHLKSVFENVAEEGSEFFPDPFEGMDEDKRPR
jgi:hypothetical protein